MKKIGYLVTLLSLTVIAGCNKGGGDTPSWDDIDLPTKVITYFGKDRTEGREEYFYTYDETGNKIEEEIFRYEGNEVAAYHSIALFTYDDQGNKTTYTFTENDDEKINENTSYQYDERGNIIQTTTKTINDWSGEFTNKYVFQYDQMNRLTASEFFSVESLEEEPKPVEKYDYQYNDDYLDYEREDHYIYSTLSSEYDLANHTIQKFDQKRRVIDATTYPDPDNEDYEKKVTYEYNDSDCIIYKETLTPKGSVPAGYTRETISATYYKNNPLQDLESTRTLYKGDTLEAEFYCKNTYDEHDRLSQVDTHDTNGDGNITHSDYYYD